MSLTNLIALMLISHFTTNAVAAEKSAAPDANMQEMMKKYEAAFTPGAQHKMLSEIAGKWKTDTKSWQTAEAQPTSSKGSATFKMILTGHFLQQDFKGDFMGKKYEGLGIMGFDNVKQKFESHWFDSLATSAMTAEGDYEASTKTIKDKATVSCPISASKTQNVRSEWQMVSKNKMVFSMFGQGPAQTGPEFKMMEITYTR